MWLQLSDKGLLNVDNIINHNQVRDNLLSILRLKSDISTVDFVKSSIRKYLSCSIIETHPNNYEIFADNGGERIATAILTPSNCEVTHWNSDFLNFIAIPESKEMFHTKCFVLAQFWEHLITEDIHTSSSSCIHIHPKSLQTVHISSFETELDERTYLVHMKLDGYIHITDPKNFKLNSLFNA